MADEIEIQEPEGAIVESVREADETEVDETPAAPEVVSE